MSSYLTEEQFNEVMSKLFEAVGKTFYSIGRSCKGKWFMRSEWTLDQEKEFEEWLTKYVRSKLRITKVLAEKKAKMFTFNYGWKYKEKK